MITHSFTDKVALITGGASGIGRATAVAFGAAGAKVVVADRNSAGGEETVGMVNAAGGEATFIACDVTQAEAVESLVDGTVNAYGRLDIAMNNAGVGGKLRRTIDTQEDDYHLIMDVNVKGVWLGMKYQLPQMLRQGGGVIVNTSSAAGLIGSHSLSLYSASKHAVIGLTKSAALEYARKGVRVNAICPSFVETPMVMQGMGQIPNYLQVTMQTNPMRRLGTPDEVVSAVLWLCSEGASFVNGVALSIDGGLVAQ